MAVTAYSNQVMFNGIASVINENGLNAPTQGNHCDLSETLVVAVYNDVENSKGMVRAGTRVSEFSVEWGTAVEFNASTTSFIIPVRVSDTKFLIVYRDDGNSSYGTAIAGTVSGTTITLGSESAFNSATTTPIGAVLMDTDKVMIAFGNSTTNGQAVMASLSGTTLSYGTVATFKATTDITSGSYTSLTQLCKHSTTLATVVYRVSATVTNTQCLSLSGTTITASGSETAIGGSADIRYPSICALSATKFVVGYTDVTDTNKGNFQACTISGTTITAGSEVTSDTTDFATRRIATLALSSTTFAFSLNTSASVFNIGIGTVSSGTTITMGTGTVMTNAKYNTTTTATNINLSSPKQGHISFSYLASTNLFILGANVYVGNNIRVKDMCFKVATAGASEQIEISSIYFINNTGSSFQSSQEAILYLNGTSMDKRIFYGGYGDQFTPVTSSNNIPITLANNPIVLKSGESLYASVKNNVLLSINAPYVVTTFGIKRT